MEAFAFLRYWCTTAGPPTATANHSRRRITKPASLDGPYFDLHFTRHQIEQGQEGDHILKSATGIRLLLLTETQNQARILTLNFEPLLSLFPNFKHASPPDKTWVKHLTKRRSTPPASIRRRDESVVVDDGIQGAILHCKTSFHS